MDQNIYETRQRAKEMLAEALAIWRNSPHADYLEGMENDPIFSLLTMAIAHQVNRIDRDINEIKKDVVKDFVRMLVPDYLTKATPASLVIECNAIDGIDSVRMDEQKVFNINGLPTSFRPILVTNVVNATLKGVTRTDGLRWTVTLNSTMPITSLSGMSFAITRTDFEDLTVYCNGKELPLIKPWDSFNLPVSQILSTDVGIYNQKLTQNSIDLCYSQFLRCNQRVFVFDNYDQADYGVEPGYEMRLVFEFRNISDKFSFSSRDLRLNTMVLANVDIESVVLSPSTPVARITDIKNSKGMTIRKQFMHLLLPSDEQLFESMDVQVRSLRSDRFTSLDLADMIHTLSDRLNSDFYAYQMFNTQDSSATLRRINILLNSLIKNLEEKNSDLIPGVYLTIRSQQNKISESTQLNVDYLTTSGASINEALNGDVRFNAPVEIDQQSIRLVGRPVPGKDTVNASRHQKQLVKYHLATHNRLVTPADIRIFCLTELTTRYDIGSFMVDRISITHEKQKEWRQAMYEILVKISLTDNRYLQSNFKENIRKVETEIAKSIEVRSLNLFPIRVEITIN
ncbi:MAG: hypothetical protein HUK08_01480 [Bacteroidaceae bacterium]|nr:hypothetical protein [Bacteroidaceae bacterium]